MDLNVPPEISLSLFYVPNATQWRKSQAIKCEGAVMALTKEAVKFTEMCYCSVLSRMALATSFQFFFSCIYRILFRYRRWLHKYFVDSHLQSSNTISRKATPTTEVALYLAYHLTRQTISGFGFSRFFERIDRFSH